MTTFTILLIDKNDNAPKFNSSEYRVRITELAQVGFALPLFIQAEDKDEVGESRPVVLRCPVFLTWGWWVLLEKSQGSWKAW